MKKNTLFGAPLALALVVMLCAQQSSGYVCQRLGRLVDLGEASTSGILKQ
jgi:hypothetical protein